MNPTLQPPVDIFSLGFSRLLQKEMASPIVSPVVYDSVEDRLSRMAQGNTISSSVPGLLESVVDL